MWSFRLPGEAQKIDRMMEAFAKRYCDENPGVFTSTGEFNPGYHMPLECLHLGPGILLCRHAWGAYGILALICFKCEHCL